MTITSILLLTLISTIVGILIGYLFGKENKP